MIANTRILVADDDPAVLQTVAWVLKEQGYDVSAAADGRTLFERLERDAPDLLLLDVAMPGSDNYQTLERIKSDDRWRDLPVLMVSSLPPDEAAVRTLGLGAADFVRKPVRVRELLARIQAQLRVRAALVAAREEAAHQGCRAPAGPRRRGKPPEARGHPPRGDGRPLLGRDLPYRGTSGSAGPRHLALLRDPCAPGRRAWPGRGGVRESGDPQPRDHTRSLPGGPRGVGMAARRY